MKSRIFLAVTLLALSAGLAVAKPNANKRVGVTITQVTNMPDGGQLKPGSYQMELLNDASAPQVAFYQNNKLVCKCPVKLENASSKIQYTKMLYDLGGGTRVLKSLSVAGWTQVVVFSGSAGSGSGT